MATECKLNQLVYTCYVKDLDPWPAPAYNNSTTQPEMMTESIVTVSFGGNVLSELEWLNSTLSKGQSSWQIHSGLAFCERWTRPQTTHA